MTRNRALNPPLLASLLAPALALSLSARLAADAAAPSGPAIASQPTPEALAGEAAAAPTALPTPAGDAGGPAMASRTAQAAPSFALPAFVVTGGGERQDLVSRGDLSTGLDTSGGITTSPGEKGQGQDQRATEAVRTTPSDETYTPVPRYGELSASYGLGDTLNLDGLLAGERGPAYGWLEGGAHSDDGGPLPSTAFAPAQRHDAHLGGEGGWRLDPDDLIEASLDGAWRSLRLTSVPAPPDTWEQRYRYGESLALEGDALWGLSQSLRLRVAQSGAGLGESFGAYYGSLYSQTGAGLDYDAAKSLGGVLLDFGAGLGGAQQTAAEMGEGPGGGIRRDLFTESLWFEGHLQPWPGARLGLGLDLNGVLGGVKAFQAGPRMHFEQSLGPDLGLRLEYGTGIGLSGLDGEAFKEDPLLPSAAALPQREVVDAKASLPWRPLPGLSLEPGAFVREDEDAFLPGRTAFGMWQDTTVGTLLVDGGGLKERYELGPWWQSLQALGQSARLSGGDAPTFIPDWTGSAELGWKQGPYSAATGLKAVGTRQASLTGSWVVGPQVDWTLRLAYDYSANLTFFIQGDSLAGVVVDWPLYTDPAPYLGVGAKMRF